MSHLTETSFPFAAILGQDNIKKALLWNMINPAIGGVLICGEKGTAKSTLVRSLKHIIPQSFQIFELPLNITEDRLNGGLDFEQAVKRGEMRLEKGILQNIHGHMLYVDEINLLSDHIVKTILDAAASGINRVEREGFSLEHEARFILVGTMNPEEGSLRPQFLDRFGLYVEVKGEQDIRKRVEITNRRLEYEKNLVSFLSHWRAENEKLTKRIARAKMALEKVTVTTNSMQLASTIAKEANCAGHRADIVIIETARAIAAWDSRIIINISDIKEAASFVLPHRAQDSSSSSPPPPQEMKNNEDSNTDSDDLDDDLRLDGENGDSSQNHESLDKPEEAQDESRPEEQQKSKPENWPESQSESSNTGESGDDNSNEHKWPEQAEVTDLPSEAFQATPWLMENKRMTIRHGSGKRSLVKSSSGQGRYVRYRRPQNKRIFDLAFDATIREAAMHQKHRKKNGLVIAVESSDLREKVREKRTGHTIVFVVDASGSMGAGKRMSAVKGAIISLLNDAYQKRDKIALVVFRNRSAEIKLGITRSVELAQKELINLATGGRTPLAAGLETAYNLIKTAKIKDKDALPVMVVVSDGKATFSEKGGDPLTESLHVARKIASEKIKAIVVNTDDSFLKLRMAEKLSEALLADRFELDELRSQTLVSAVKFSLGS